MGARTTEQTAVFDLVTAARLLGVGRTSAYQLVRAGLWPTPVIKMGKLIRVPKGPLLELLGLEAEPEARGQ